MKNDRIIDAIANNPYLLAWAFLGAAILYMMNKLHGHQPFSLFKVLNINLGVGAKPWVILLDIIFSSSMGTLVVFALTLPSTEQQAIAAGLGMTGVLSAATQKE